MSHKGHWVFPLNTSGNQVKITAILRKILRALSIKVPGVVTGNCTFITP